MKIATFLFVSAIAIIATVRNPDCGRFALVVQAAFGAALML